jgi:hypothetical protein
VSNDATPDETADDSLRPYTITVVAAGVAASDIDLRVEEGVLVARGATASTGACVARRIRLPRDAHFEAARAMASDGILTVVVPKKPPTVTRVEVKGVRAAALPTAAMPTAAAVPTAAMPTAAVPTAAPEVAVEAAEEEVVAASTSAKAAEAAPAEAAVAAEAAEAAEGDEGTVVATDDELAEWEIAEAAEAFTDS